MEKIVWIGLVLLILWLWARPAVVIERAPTGYVDIEWEGVVIRGGF